VSQVRPAIAASRISVVVTATATRTDPGRVTTTGAPLRVAPRVVRRDASFARTAVHGEPVRRRPLRDRGGEVNGAAPVG
jgi:hypothetical protein